MITPPKLPLRFLRWFCREEYIEEIEGDLYELFEKRFEESPGNAKRRFIWDVIRSFRPVNIKKLKSNNWTMNAIQHYIKVYFRRFKKETIHYMVNIAGLAMGLAVLFFILMYVYDELHMDSGHSKANRIYRVIEKRTSDEGQVQYFSATANPLAKALKAEFPEIEETAKMIYTGSGGLEYNQRSFSDRNYAFANSELFKILDFNIIQGDPFQDFNGPVAVALSQSTARKLFGNENPVGKVVSLPGKLDNVEVIALYENLPNTYTYQFNTVYITRFEDIGYFRDWFASWDSRGATTWALFKENADPKTVLAKKDGFLQKYCGKELAPYHDFSFQQITDIHLSSHYLDEFGTEPLKAIPYSRWQFVVVILVIGILVTCIAALNYINLSSVQALKRTKEAGIRKVNGATMRQLKSQLFVETFITLSISYVVSVCLLALFHSQFLQLANKSIPFSGFFQADLVIYYLLTFIGIWILSSLIPAVYYSRFSSSLVLFKNAFSGKGDMLRKAFVTVQYGISLILIIGSMVLYRQLTYVQSKDLGFTNEKLLTLDINSNGARDNFQSIINGLVSNSNIVNASVSSRVPGEWKSLPTVGLTQNQNQKPFDAFHYAVDRQWFETYGMEIFKGSNFSGNTDSDSLKVILNEKTVEMLGLENPIGEAVFIWDDTVYRMQVIGVVKNFHFESLHMPLGPVVITSWNNPIFGIDYFTIKYRGNTSDVLAHIEGVQQKFDPETPAEINFLNEQWDRYYQADQSRSNLVLVATIISIIISVFGLFGLVNFTAERKTKEVGIRKVLGASVPDILRIILKDYLLLLLIALVIATPIAWWVLNHWLNDFAYRIELSPGIFSFAFIVVLLISFATVIFRVYRLAKSNPVDSLRYE